MSTPSPSSSASSSTSQPPQYRMYVSSFSNVFSSHICACDSIGVLLAVGSGLLIGSSFVFKKKGLLSSQNGHAAGEGVAYLKSVSEISSSFRRRDHVNS